MAKHEEMSKSTTCADETNGNGEDKVKRYGWTLVDEPGQFMMIPKWKLRVDEDYQRSANSTKILDLASGFSWKACGVILVGKRDGKMWVYDGQHRVLAAMKRSDIKELPCMVFRTKSQAEEARGFLNANTLRKPVNAIDKFRAAVTAGDQIAIYVKRILDERGITVGKDSDHPRVLRCIDRAQRLATTDKAMFDEIIDFLLRLCGDSMGINERLLGGIHYLHKHCSTGLKNKKLAERLIESGPGRLMEGAGRAAAYYAKGGPKIFAEGFLNVINKGLHERFELEPAN